MVATLFIAPAVPFCLSVSIAVAPGLSSILAPQVKGVPLTSVAQSVFRSAGNSSI